MFTVLNAKSTKSSCNNGNHPEPTIPCAHCSDLLYCVRSSTLHA